MKTHSITDSIGSVDLIDETKEIDLSLSGLRTAYREDSLTPRVLIKQLRARINQHSDNPVWISLMDEVQLEQYCQRLDQLGLDALPLYGIPFAVKDNIDLAGLPTTAACPDFAYQPDRHSTVVQRLVDAGAIPLGKTNLDQFATGLNGTRSPYGAPRNPRNQEYISGGSSSGSAVAMALNQVSFALGTDTAGSGRVPAALNNLIGLKPSRGLISCAGVLPACQTLDCVSILALNCDDANTVLSIAEGFDANDPYSRQNSYDNAVQHYCNWQGEFKFGVQLTEQLDFCGDSEASQLFKEAIARLKSIGGQAIPIDCAPLLAAGKLLYEGPWVAERYSVIESFLQQQPQAVLPVIEKVLSIAPSATAVEGFRAQYQLQAYAQQAQALMHGLDCLVMPTMPTAFTIEQLRAEPVLRNSELGLYTNFVNLLDMSAIAIPAGFLNNEVGWGVTLIGPAWSDRKLLSLSNRYCQNLPFTPGHQSLARFTTQANSGCISETIDVVVCGAHLQGMALNHQLTARAAILRDVTQTKDTYRLYVLPDGKRPALVKSDTGRAIEVEVWSVPKKDFGSFVANIPAPLGIGRVDLTDGRNLTGFIAAPEALHDATDITQYGGWKAWLKRSEC